MYSLSSISLFLLILSITTVHAQAPIWSRAQLLGDVGGTALATVAMSDGGVVVSGLFEHTMTIGDTTLTQHGQPEMYVARFDVYGSLEWVRQFGGRTGTGDFAEGLSLAVDAAGNTYIAGLTFGQITIDTMLLADGYYDLLIVKLAPDGTVLWVRHIGDGMNAEPYPFGSIIWGTSITVDADGSGYIGGAFAGDLNIGSTKLRSRSGWYDGFIARFDADGIFSWAKKLGGSNADYVATVSTDARSNCLVAYQSESASADTLRPLDLQVAVFDSTGVVRWSKQIPRVGSETVQSAAACFDPNGDILLTSCFATPLDSLGDRIENDGGWDLVVAKLSANGSLKWTRHSRGSGSDVPTALAVDAEGTSYVTGGFTGTVTFGEPQASGGRISLRSVGDQDVFVAAYDSTGDFIWATSAGGDWENEFAGGDFARGVAVTSDGSIAVVGEFALHANFGSTRLDGAGLQHGFVAVLGATDGNTISGTVFNDIDGDGMRDPNERGEAGRLVSLGSVAIATTDSLGHYRIRAPHGAHQLSLAPKRHWQQPLPRNVAFTWSEGDTLDGVDFGTHADDAIDDLSVTLTNHSAARPGFEGTYTLTCTNLGTNTADASITLAIDRHVELDSSDPPESIADPLTWTIDDLAVGAERRITLRMRVDSTTALGRLLRFTASVDPVDVDAVQYDNADTLDLEVRGSYDPNDLHVFPEADLETELVDAGSRLTYVVRFQNTGTDTAFAVRIVDTLDGDLDVSSLTIEAASHPLEWNIESKGIVTFRFANIMLLDSNTSEPASHGFVKFSVNPKPANAPVSNQAAIYFDFNAPIFTNTTFTRFDRPISFIPEISLTAASIVVPNPVIGRSRILLAEHIGRVHLTIIDTRGVIVREYETPHDTDLVIDASELATGSYFYVVTSRGRAIARGGFQVQAER